jgi:hypothetical protein
MATRFHLRRQGLHWAWVLIDEGDGQTEQKILAQSPLTWPTKGEANAAVEQARRGVLEADTVVDTTVPQSRWRVLGPDGSVGAPVGDDPPDKDDEGETGPPEVVDLTPRTDDARPDPNTAA